MSSLQHLGKGALRVAKNYTKGYSDTQAKVRDATSNDPWGPSGTQMNEIARMSYNQSDFVEIMEMLDKRLNDKGKNWRHVWKSLTLLDYLLHSGSENVVIYFRDNLYIIKTLREFQYVDEYGKDQGANIRQKAKDITNLLMDESRLREERRTRSSMRNRMTNGGTGNDVDDVDDVDDENNYRRSLSVPPTRRPQEDEMRKAIEESKRSLAAEQAKAAATAEERDLQRAIQLSREEEEKRNKALQDANSSALFDDHNQLPPPTANNPFPLVDPSAQQFQTGLQPQFTSVQPQFTSFNPWQQQAQQEAMQAEYMRQQAEWMRQQQEAAAAQQQAQQQAQLQQAQQEEWMRQQQMMQFQQQQQMLQAQQQPLMAQPTGFGSNNPFAPSPASFSPPPLPSQISSPGPQQQPSSDISFNLQGTYANANNRSDTSSAPPGPSQSAPPRGPTRADQEHAHLANLFANREDDGLDTFGNTGLLRYGATDGGRTLISQKTGTNHNPFGQQQQQQQSSEQPFFQI